MSTKKESTSARTSGTSDHHASIRCARISRTPALSSIRLNPYSQLNYPCVYLTAQAEPNMLANGTTWLSIQCGAN
jgi:hypothetical protein